MKIVSNIINSVKRAYYMCFTYLYSLTEKEELVSSMESSTHDGDFKILLTTNSENVP